MSFPIVIVKSNEAPLYYSNGDVFGLVSKGGESFYKKGTIYDSDGSKYEISGIETIEKAPLLKSIRYFQRMYMVKPQYSFISGITLVEFKQLIIFIHSKSIG
ncbi:MAG: hypothetical protein J0H74_28270 [Chitinophagaceae bacterium]|nr:hypothetical protein [Chitinophagaceae bacterium]